MLVPTIWKPNFNTWMFSSSSVDILDDMLAGVGWTMHDYLKYGANDYYPPLPNGHRLFLHDIRRVAVRAAVAMGEEGDIVVSFWSHTLLLSSVQDLHTDIELGREKSHYSTNRAFKSQKEMSWLVSNNNNHNHHQIT